jgi:hypothetical protein
MRKIVLSLAVLAAILLPALYAAPAHATNFHSWVSHSNGSDVNSCTSSTPCATFGRALSQTQDGGTVNCLDSGSFDVLTITISVVIDCSGTVATTPYTDNASTCVNVSINAPGKIVTLRGLRVTGPSLTGSCPGFSGIVITAATAVSIEDCVIENFLQKGIFDQRTSGGTKLVIKNTIVRNTSGAGIVVAAAFRNTAVLDNVHSVGNSYGIAVATGSNVVINRSVMSENSVAGIEADPGAFVYVDNTMISQNGSYGVLALGTVGLANSDITFNVSSISGTTTSFGNNRLFQNGPGTAPTPAGATSTDFGQQ